MNLLPSEYQMLSRIRSKRLCKWNQLCKRTARSLIRKGLARISYFGMDTVLVPTLRGWTISGGGSDDSHLAPR